MPFLPINMSYRSTGMSFFDLHPVELARQITLLEHEAFLETSTDEWVTANWNGSIGRVIARFNDMSRWVSTEIVTADTAHYRALLIQRFVLLASTLLSLNNFNGVMEVLTGLQAASVARLGASWACVSGEAAKAYRALSEQMSLDSKNAAKFRQRMEQAAAPCVPYIGFYVQELALLEESSPTYYEDGRINFPKQYGKIGLIDTLATYQGEGRAAPYNLVKVEFVQEFVKVCASSVSGGMRVAKLLSDDELMAASCRREVPSDEEDVAGYLSENGLQRSTSSGGGGAKGKKK
eukprot:TRINITY_DN2115_c0_g1_i1.p1 TRINITY_DN2115_c0_g1~~TRINITY_DN2115_c0_g1_i1.p1  ORF type:complete len:292 (-),score=83.89 TRINITY_DN2115_c0_g1_i1:24-899(-)